MEHRRRRPHQARKGRRADPPASGPLRARRPAALRPGQVVSGRDAAALDLLALLAQGRQAALVGSRSAGVRDLRNRRRHGRRREADDGDRHRARRGGRRRRRRLRRPRRMAAQGRQASRQCRPVEFQARRPGRAGAHGARLRARPDQPDRLCAAGPALAVAGERSAAGAPRNGTRVAASCSWCRAIRRSATACRWARCPTCRPSEYPQIVPLDPTIPRGQLAGPQPAGLPRRRAREQMAGCRWPTSASRPPLRSAPTTPRARTASSRNSTPSTAPCARRLPSRCATAGFASSCRRSRRSRTISTRRRGRGVRAPASACRCRSRAIRHPPTRASTSSASRPIPASSRSTSIRPRSWRECGRHHHRGLRGGAAVAARRRQVHDRRPPLRHRRRQPCRGRRRHAGRQPVPAPSGPAQEPRALLAAPSVAVLSLLRPVHRTDQPGAAHRRGAPRFPLRAGDRAGAGAAAGRGQAAAAVAGRPAVPQPAGRCHRQHPPLRDLHRQALFARYRLRPAGAGRVPRLRDAAEPAHEPGAATPHPGDHRPPVEEAVDRRLRALGHRAARPLHAALVCLAGLPRCAGRPEDGGLRHAAGMVRGAEGVPLPLLRRGGLWRRQSGTAGGAGALACHGRAGRDRRHGPLCRFVGRAPAGEDRRAAAGTPSRGGATGAPCR